MPQYVSLSSQSAHIHYNDSSRAERVPYESGRESSVRINGFQNSCNNGWSLPLTLGELLQLKATRHSVERSIIIKQYQSYNRTSACWQDADAYNLMRVTSSRETIEGDFFSGNNRMAATDLRSASSAR